MRSAAQRVASALALCVAVLAMQSIGLLHGHVHPHDPPVGRASQALQPPRIDTHADAAAVSLLPSGAQGTLPALFAGHDDASAGCTLFDQLTHADLLYGPPVHAVACAAPGQPDAVHAAWHHARQVAGFLARAPPALG